MKYALLPLCVFLIAVPAVSADVSIDELRLDWQEGEIVLEIDASGTFQFTHEIAEAKDGKPFRVVVDLFPAVHNLGQEAFSDLPSSIVKSIRTSQFTVKPVRTVRVVLDLERASIYRISKEGNSIYLSIPDNKSSGFPVWSSRRNHEIKGEVAKSEKIPGKPAVIMQSTASKEIDDQPSTERARPEFSYKKPRQSSAIDRDKMPPLPVVSVGTPPEIEVAVVEQLKSEKDIEQVHPEMNKAEAEVKQEVKPTPNIVKPDVQEPVVTKEEQAPAPSKSEELIVAEKPQSVKSEETKKPTSRFRRQPAFPAKLKGTIVAEFPKRMTLKYKPRASRDPFASLFDETSQLEGIHQKKIPDVETSRLVGILESASGQNRALLEDKNGYGYILESGDKIKKGYVSKIYPDKALFQVFEYGWSRTVALHLGDND